VQRAAILNMMEWWNEPSHGCLMHLIASERAEPIGPVREAVRSVGYQSGEEMESNEEEVPSDEHEHRVLPAAGTAPVAERAEGSSVEEEPDVETAYDHPPDYTHPEKHYTLHWGRDWSAWISCLSNFFFFLSYLYLTFCRLRKSQAYTHEWRSVQHCRGRGELSCASWFPYCLYFGPEPV